MANVTLVLTKEEADLVLSQLCGRADDFDQMIVAEGKKPHPSADRLVELGVIKKNLKSVMDKLVNAGASLWG